MPTASEPAPGSRSTALAQAGGYLIGPAFVVLAAYFLLTEKQPEIPSAASPEIPAALIQPVTLRAAMGDPPSLVIAGYDQRCNACHKLFRSLWDGKRPLMQHTHIELNHGLNNECNNCHALEDREKLILHDLTMVSYSNVVMLCAQCHGLVYRDWQRGTHGITLGYWNDAFGEPRRATCTACHDPHSPAFAPMDALPGPNTLRMGDPSATTHGGHGGRRNPLRRYSSSSSEAERSEHETEARHSDEKGGR